jgi:protein phosphatase
LQESNQIEVLQKDYILHERYRIDSFLEVKKGANLYRALDEVTNIIVILKEKIHKNFERRTNLDIGNDKIKDNPWYDEFAILRSVTYPTVVKAVDIFSENGKYYLVVEQLEGNDLRYFLTKNKINIQQSCDWMIQLCQSLSQLHRRKIVHLDLQTRYIVVTKDLQRVRLTGFDSAVQLPFKNNNPEISIYSSPELIFNKEVDNRSDIYSLGVIWHEIITGFKPTEENIKDKWFKMPEILEFNPSISPQLNRIINKMLQVNPDERYNNVDELKKDILSLYNSTTYVVGYYTDVGMVRDSNEDSFSVYTKKYLSQTNSLNYGIFVVADGMGGAKAGEYASAIASKEVSNYISYYLEETSQNNLNDDEIRNILEHAVKRANTFIYKESKENKEYSGMGTTLTAALIYDNQLYIAHVGDSRAYLINQSSIEKITRDHSLVGRLLELGQITQEEALTHPQRNLIYRSLGGFPAVEVEIYQLVLKANDYILICSDGLYEHINDNEIKTIVLSSDDPSKACKHLINLANIRGGDDNCTVILIKIQGIN